MNDLKPSHDVHPKISQEPAFFLLILILSVFLGEIVTMILLPHIVPLHLINGSIIDALMLVVVVSPILYLFSFRPLQSHIRELKHMQDELRRGEERYRSLVESSDDSIYLVDRNYRYLFINTKYQARIGLTEGKGIGFTYGDHHSLDDAGEFEKIIDKVFETGNPLKQEHQSRRDGRHFLRTFSPVKDPLGVVEAVTVISKDITDLKSKT